MSCSQFIEHEEDKNDTLVLIVNGNGTVSLDPLTFEHVLKTRQHREAVSVIRFENTNEPDSQTEKVDLKDEKTTDDKDKPCRRVNLVVEAYYPPSLDDKNIAAESLVSSTVGTPPLPQTTSEFLDLLSEGLEIPASQTPTQSNMHATAGCLGDSLVDAFSEMAPEQLKQVETALHSEKAKQILGDDVTSVLDTLKLNEEQDDWVHFDHCYTNIYGSKKQNQPERVQNVVVQDSEVATMLTIKMAANDDASSSVKKETNVSAADTSNSSYENLELTLPENIEVVNVSSLGEESANDNVTTPKKKAPTLQNKPKVVTGNKVMPFQGTLSSNEKEILSNARRERPSLPQTHKIKPRKSTASKNVEIVPERIVTEDEVDGVKVFKPTRNDRRPIKPFVLKDLPNIPKPQLVQSKLNFGKKDPTSSGIDLHDKSGVVAEVTAKSNGDSKDKKEAARKPGTPITPETFGPALFSTPDIIRKITEESTSPTSNDASNVTSEIADDQTAEIEKRMSAIENGEAILDQLHLEMEMQKELERITSQSDDDKLLSDLENSADEDAMDISVITATSAVSYESSSKNLDLEDSESENSASTNDDSAEKTEGEYEDDPNKLWCICNKPHSNRFMICCDACDNWFHGTCVGITKAMGEKMEQNGTEWLCPSCKKEKCAKERENKLKQSTTRSTASRLASRHSGTESANSTISSSGNTSADNSLLSAGDQTPNAARRKSSSYGEKPEKPTPCAECKEKESMPNAAYCSHECIIAHVTNSLTNMNSGQRIPLSDDKKIIVVDRKSGHRISGLRAPAVGNLKEWLLQHPSYEIVRPSALPTSRPEYPPTYTKPQPKKAPQNVVKSKDSQFIKSRTQLIKKLSVEGGGAKPTDGMTQVSMKQFLVKRASNENINDKRDPIRAKIKRPDDIANVTIKDGVLVRKDDPRLKDKGRQIQLIPVQPLSKPEEQKEKLVPVVKKILLPPQPVVEKKKKIEPPVEEKTTPKKVENKRPEIKKKEPAVGEPSPSNAAQSSDKVRENVRKGINEFLVIKMKESTNIKITEEEASVLAKKIEEELYNLLKDNLIKYKAKYRSLKFNIEQPQNSLFERIVEKSLSPYELVRLTPDELACAELAQWRQREAKHEIEMIKKTELENLSQSKVLVMKTHKGELEIESESLPSSKPDLIVPDLESEEIPEDKSGKKGGVPSYFNKEKERNAAKEKSKDEADKKDRDKHKKHDYKDKHKSRKHHRRSSEREKYRSRSRRGSKSPDKERHRSTSAEKSSHRSRSVEKSHRSDKDSRRDRSKKHRSRSRSHKRREKSPERKEQTVVADKIKTEPEEVKKEEDKPPIEDDTVPAELLNPFKSIDVDLSDMEPTSTVTIKTPPYAHSPDTPSCVWKGQVAMPDVAKFYTILKEVSGNCEALDEDLQSNIDCVGRIHPNTVWDYINKVKKSGSKEILVLRFESPEPEEHQNYMNLYVYLSTKNRMAVVGNAGPAIKDFYVTPLPSHSPVPQVLLPLDGPGFEDNRPHLLLGIVVRSRRKKYFSNTIVSHPTTSAPSKKPMDHEPYVPMVPQLPPPPLPQSSQQDSFTPPHSPTSVFVNTQVPITTTIAKNDEDEPYSPEDDEPYSPGGLEEDQSKSGAEDASSQLEDSKQEDSVNSSGPGNDAEHPELYSPSEHFFNDIESEEVTLPADLQKLLNSFKNRSSEPTPPPTAGTILEVDPIVDAYKKSADKLDEDVDDVALEEVAYSPPPGVVDDDDDEDDDDNNDDDIQNLDSDLDEEPKKAEPEREPEPEEKVEKAEVVEEAKLNRDPRRKAPVPVVEAFRTPMVSQPPPPGMEDEFSPPGVPKSDVMTGVMPPDAGYTTQMPTAAYAYPTAQSMQPYTQLIPQMYMSTAPVYPQPGALPFTAMPPPQIYVPPPMMHRTDPSLIPLPMETPDTPKKQDKRKMDDDKEADSDDKKSDSKSKKHKSYYSSDSKGGGDSRSSPNRHHSSSYDSHRRGYQRDDVEYSSSSSRYGHKYSRSYRDRGDRGGYWKSGSDYPSSSSSSSSHKKYSHSSSSDRDRSSSSRRNRWESSKHDDEDWDDEINKNESKRDKDKSEHSKKSESSKHS